MNHRQRRQLIKKEKRKKKRQSEAQTQCTELEKEEQEKLNSPTYAAQTIQEDLRDQAQLRWEEAESKRKHKLWLLEEQRALKAIQLKKEWEEKEAQRIRDQEQKIREEWEERQKIEKEEQEKREKDLQEKKERQEKLLQEATANEKTGTQAWHNPIAPYNYGVERKVEACPFFFKTGTCRFGERCSRGHPLPETSTIMMLPGMYTHFELTQGLQEEHDTDIALEYEDNELYKNFIEFYEDIVPEFKAIGRIVQVKVCCNYEPHLRGNVYIQYKHLEDALKAFAKFNARWYGGKQLSCQFVEITKWKMAICGLFGKRTCPKGKSCNFLHVFRNPNNEFWQADQDLNIALKNDHNVRSRYNNRNYYDRYDRSSSRSSYYTPRRNSSRHSRSPSHSRDRYRHRSRSHSRHKQKRSKRSRSRSRSTGKARNKSHSRSHSSRKSKNRSRSRSKSPRRNRSNSKRQYRSRNEKSHSSDSSSGSSRSRSRSHSHSKQIINQNCSEFAALSGSQASITSSQNRLLKDEMLCDKLQQHPEDKLPADSDVNGTTNRRSRSSSRSSLSSRGRHHSHKKHKKHKHRKHRSEH